MPANHTVVKPMRVVYARRKRDDYLPVTAAAPCLAPPSPIPLQYQYCWYMSRSRPTPGWVLKKMLEQFPKSPSPRPFPEAHHHLPQQYHTRYLILWTQSIARTVEAAPLLQVAYSCYCTGYHAATVVSHLLLLYHATREVRLHLLLYHAPAVNRIRLYCSSDMVLYVVLLQ